MGQVNIFCNTVRADFGWRSVFPSHVNSVAWLEGVAACGRATRAATPDDDGVAMMPLRRSKFSTRVMKELKVSLLKSAVPFSKVA